MTESCGKGGDPFASGWLPECRRVLSPNFDARPAGAEISLLVVHAISLPPGEFGGGDVADLFCNRLDAGRHPFFAEIQGLRVSAHFFVRRDGELIQFVSCDARAWHAGASVWQGRERCNDFSIGIELEGCDDLAFESAQYATLNRLIAQLCQRYPLLTAVGHSDIAPGRKTDPGPHFDWSRVVAIASPHSAR
jgi:AmpD protein